MASQFITNRTYFYVLTFLLTIVVLGLSANFANLFLPHLHPDFTIFSLVVTSLTIFAFLLSFQWATPRTEAILMFLLAALWLAMGAWSTDVIGNVQCDGLGGQRTPTKTGDMSLKAYCREMKVTEAFSWMLFVLFAIAFSLILALVSQAQRFGMGDTWAMPIRELRWFGEGPGMYNQGASGQQQYGPGQMGYAQPGMQYPGTSTIIQPGVNGAPPTVRQVPLGAV
ncbi:hypothetical protein HGRIS_005027 [Hohenbuehelia grisea]|uniref:MARVEL domain-containing protein n=1 Tax=Hohenbuehelia grisea TaxID=104357 RepID=A0ABR3JDR4_9AGAR